MALYELRQYKVRDGNMPAWLDLMEGEIIPYVVSKGMVFNASFAAEDDPTIYIWLRRFEDEADRARLYDAVYESERWKSDLSPKIGALLVREGECHEFCVSGLAHAGFRYGHALKRSSNIIAN